ncbi:MAG: hypothetical protein WBQ41_03890 [Solirubrobacterales bacterium]
MGGCQSVEFAYVGSTHFPFEDTYAAVLEGSDRFDSEIWKGVQEAGRPVADSLMTSVDDVKRDILVSAIRGKESREAFDILTGPSSGPLLS